MLLVGCATRGYTRAYSDLEKENQQTSGDKSGIEIYQKYLTDNNERLYRLLEKRSRDVSVGDYLIGAGDRMNITVLGVPELNTEVRVSQTGEIALPLIGTLKVAGLTERQAQEELSNALKVHLRDPELKLALLEYGGSTVSVLGAVQKPGKIAVKKGATTLVEVLGEAGGISAEAGNFLSLTPSDADLTETVSIELPLGVVLGLNGSLPLEIPIRNGDAIVVQPAGQILVEGEVENRGSYSLSDNLTLVGALAAAGGVTYGAKYDEIEIVRRLGEQQVVSLVFDLEQIQSGVVDNPLLKNGDIVRVPSDSGKRMSQDFFNGLRRFIGIGGFIPL